jgi:rRNA processing protein Krr1/Pno1
LGRCQEERTERTKSPLTPTLSSRGEREKIGLIDGGGDGHAAMRLVREGMRMPIFKIHHPLRSSRRDTERMKKRV